MDQLYEAHMRGLKFNANVCERLATRLECLKYVFRNGCSWNERACYKAAFDGKLDCLRFLHENGCKWDESTCHIAARNGHIECLIYAYEHGCPFPNNIWSPNIDCMCYIATDMLKIK